MLIDYFIKALCSLTESIIILLCMPLVFVFLIFASFCFGPCFYFQINIDSADCELREKYRVEGLRLSGQVVKRWSDNDGGHCISVLYQIAGEKYVKDFKVIEAVQSQTCNDIVVLPQYPRSADMLALIEQNNVWGASEWCGICFSLIWFCSWNVGVVYSILIEVLKDEWQIALIIVACEVILAWIIGYYVVRANCNADLRTKLFGAKLYRSGEIHPAPMPYISYQELFPSSTKSFQSIIWNIISDYAKFVFGILMFFLFFAFGGSFILMRPFFVERKMKQLFAEEYMTKGIALTGTVVDRTDVKVKVQYDAVGSSLSMAQRYEKILYVPRYRTSNCPSRFESKPVLDNPHLIILPNLPNSARLADEIEFCNQIYEKNWTTIIIAIIVCAVQTTYAAFLVVHLFPDIPTWHMVLICVAPQIIMGFPTAFLFSRYIRNRVLYDATLIAASKSADVVKDDTESAKSSLDDSGWFTNALDPTFLESKDDEVTLSESFSAMGRPLD